MLHSPTPMSGEAVSVTRTCDYQITRLTAILLLHTCTEACPRGHKIIMKKKFVYANVICLIVASSNTKFSTAK